MDPVYPAKAMAALIAAAVGLTLPSPTQCCFGTQAGSLQTLPLATNYH